MWGHNIYFLKITKTTVSLNYHAIILPTTQDRGQEKLCFTHDIHYNLHQDRIPQSDHAATVFVTSIKVHYPLKYLAISAANFLVFDNLNTISL